MNEPWRITLGLLFVGMLAAGLSWVLGADDERRSGATPPAPSTMQTRPLPPQAAAAAGPEESITALSGTVAATPTTTTTVQPASPGEVEIREVLPAVQRALSAWGEFAVTGDLSLVAEAFDRRGPQYEQLVEESATLLADPLGPPPYVFAMDEVTLQRLRPQRVVLEGPVSISRAGEPDRSFRWRVHLRWSGSEWLLWTVEDIVDR